MSKRKYPKVRYLGGIPSRPSACTCTFQMWEQGIGLHRWGRCVARIAYTEIHNAQVVPFLSLFPPATQNKSVIGRAVVGGLLLGPLGAVVGGMSGVGQKQSMTYKQQVHKNDFVLLIEATQVGIQYRCGFVFPAMLLKERAATKPFEMLQQMRLRANAQQFARVVQPHQLATAPPTAPVPPPLPSRSSEVLRDR